MVNSINHIGIAVKDLEVSKELYSKIFGVKDFHIEIVEEQNVKVASFDIGGVMIELTQATNENSPIAKFIAKKGEGIHHIAFSTNEINHTLTSLENSGIELINKQATSGAHNMNIAFLHPKSTGGVLIELCEPKI